MDDNSVKEEYFLEHEKKYLKEQIRKTIGFIRKNNIKTVVIAGYSGVYARDFLKNAWKKLYPSEKMPKFYSLGDSPERTMTSSRRFGWKTDAFPRFERDIRKRMPSLPKALKEPVLVFDELKSYGNTLKNTVSLMKKLGANEVRAFPLVDWIDIRPPKLSGRGDMRSLLQFNGGRKRKGEGKPVVDAKLKDIKTIKGELRKLAREL